MYVASIARLIAGNRIGFVLNEVYVLILNLTYEKLSFSASSSTKA